MNVNAAGHVPPYHHRRPVTQTVQDAPTTTTDAAGADTAPVDGTTPTDEPAPPARPGGSDTPFTHALHQGNGKKLGILKRLPTPDDVAAEQAAAGLSADGVTGEGDAVAPVDGDAVTPVDGTVPADDEAVPAGETGGEEAGGVVIDGSSLAIGGGDEGSSVVDELAEAVAAATEAAQEDAVEQLLVDDPAPEAFGVAATP